MIYKEALETMIDSTFDQAKAAAESQAMLDRSSERARAQLAEGVLGDVGYRQRMNEIQANREQVRQRLEASIAEAREKYNATTAALRFDPESLSPQLVGFVGSVPLGDDEARQMLGDAVMRGDLAAWRLVEANLGRQGKSLGSGFPEYLEAMGGVANDAARYARAIGSEDPTGYLQNETAIKSKLMEKVEKTEAEFLAFPIFESTDDDR